MPEATSQPLALKSSEESKPFRKERSRPWLGGVKSQPWVGGRLNCPLNNQVCLPLCLSQFVEEAASNQSRLSHGFGLGVLVCKPLSRLRRNPDGMAGFLIRAPKGVRSKVPLPQILTPKKLEIERRRWEADTQYPRFNQPGLGSDSPNFLAEVSKSCLLHLPKAQTPFSLPVSSDQTSLPLMQNS